MSVFMRNPTSDELGPYARNMMLAVGRLGLDDIKRDSPCFESLARTIDELARRVVELEAKVQKMEAASAKGDA